MKKTLFIILGFLFVALGILGIFLPLMPTTIFLIIASYFFMKSSPELNEKLLNNKYLGKYIKDYKEKKGMPKKAKVNAILLLWISIIISGYFFTANIYVRILLLIIAVCVTIYIFSLKTLENESVQNQEIITE